MTDRIAEIEILNPGLYSSIQGLSNNENIKFGVPVGGALDIISHRNANILVGNSELEPTIEITMVGPEIKFYSDCTIAITGANLSPSINNVPVKLNEQIFLKENDILKFGKRIYGCRSYISVGGHWQMAKLLGHYVIKNQRNKLNKGDLIRIESDKYKTEKIELNLTEPLNDKNHIIEVNKGPEYDKFSEIYINFFFNNTFIIDKDSNRMGLRLRPKNILNVTEFNFDIISSGILPGTVQVSNSGLPIILLADCQTIGGYYRIVKIMEEEMPKLAQLIPGDYIKFQLIN